MKREKISISIFARILSLTFLSLLLIASNVPVISAHNAPFPPGYDPTHFIIDTLGEPETLDPAWGYDTTSGEVIQNVYDTLIFFDVKYEEGPYSAGKTDSFVPKLADLSYPIDWSEVITHFDPPYPTNPKSGLVIVSRWTFPIRTNVEFHNGLTMTPADVEYSFEREMVQDRVGGPQWMFFESLLGVEYALAPLEDPDFGLKIDGAVESNSTHMWLNLATSYPELVFKQILSQTWSSVVCKAWAISMGDLDIDSVPGGWSNWEQIYSTWHDPPVSFIEGDMVGTGPYKFSYWNLGVSYELVRNHEYWAGWPAPWKSSVGGPGDSATLGGYIETVTWYVVYNGITDFLSGISDETNVPIAYRDQVLGQIVGGEKIRCHYPLLTLSATGFFFTFDIATTSDFMGVPLPPGTFSTAGIPPDIFSDINVRKGFAYAFNYAEWIEQVKYGEGEQSADPVLEGMVYDNAANSKYVYDLNKAEYHLKLAWGGIDGNNDGDMEDPEDSPGALWTGGMKFTIPYPVSSTPTRQVFAQVMATNVNSLNPTKFLIDTLAVSYGFVYLTAMVAHEIPIFVMGYYADNNDPSSMVFPFMDSAGAFPSWQRYSDPRVDELIDTGIATPDDTALYNGELDKSTYDELKAAFDNWPNIPPDMRWPRRSIYYELQAIYHEDVPGVFLVQDVGRHWEQAWMRGWYYNPLYPGEYVYHRWKALTHFGDVSSAQPGIADGAVDTYDLTFIQDHYSTGSIFGFHPVADIDGGTGATTGSQYGPVAGMPDGKVGRCDLNLVLDQWDNPPGPTHGGPSHIHSHDVAVTSVTPSRSVARSGRLVNIDVTLENQGCNEETFDVTVYANTIPIGTQSVTLASGTTTTITFTWDATGFNKGDYVISAYATPVQWEDDTTDNTCTDGTVTVLYPSDLNEDGIVDIADASLVSAHWYPGPPIGPLGYDPDFDVDHDGAIDLFEISLVSAYWTGPPKGPLDP